MPSGGYHLHSNSQRLALPGGAAGLVLAQRSWMIDGPQHASRIGVQRNASDYRLAPTATGHDRPLGSRQSIRKRELQSAAGPKRHAAKHEP